MKLQLAIDGCQVKYRIETTAIIPESVMTACKIVEAGFSPNPFEPVTIYLVPRSEPNLQQLLDRILDAEVKG